MGGPLSGTTCAVIRVRKCRQSCPADEHEGVEDDAEQAAYCSVSSAQSTPVGANSSVSDGCARKVRRIRRRPLPLHLFSALCLFILAAGSSSIPTASAQPGPDDRRTNEDFLFDLDDGPTVSVTPFQLRLFASAGRNLQLGQNSIAAVRRSAQRYVDGQLRRLYNQEGYAFDYVRLEVLDSAFVVRGDGGNNNDGGGSRRRHALLRGRRTLQKQAVVNNDNNRGGKDDDEGTAITLGGEITFVYGPAPDQRKIDSGLLSAMSRYDDLREVLLSSGDPVLRLVDAVDVQSMAAEQDSSAVEGGKDVLPPWMEEVGSDVEEEVEGGQVEATDATGNEVAEEDGAPTKIVPSLGDSISDSSLDNGPKDYPKGTAVSAEKGPSTPDDPSGDTSTATIIIAVLSVLLGLAAVGALALLLIKRRNAKSDELISEWSIGGVAGYKTAISPAAAGGAGSNENDKTKAVLVTSATMDTASPDSTTKGSQNSSPSADDNMQTQPFAFDTTSPRQADTDAETPTASGPRQQLNVTPRPEVKAAPINRRSSFRSVSSTGTDALLEVTGCTGVGGTHIAKTGGGEGNGAIKMRSLASGVSRPPPTPSTSENKVTTITPLPSEQARLSRAESGGTKSTCSQDEVATNNNAAAIVRHVLSTNDSLNSGPRPPIDMGPTAGAFPTSGPGSHYVSRNSLQSYASASYQTSVDGDTHNSGAYLHNGIDTLHPMDWSCRGFDTEGEDGEAHSVSNSTLTTECPPNAETGAYPALPASLLDGADGGRAIARAAGVAVPISTTHQDTESPGDLYSPQTQETSTDFLSPSTGTGTATSRASSSDRSGEGANELIKDLLWLEGKLAHAQASKARAASGGQQNHAALFSPVGKTSGNRDPYKDREAKRRKDTQSIVCRDCYAPPGKLHIVIHTTKDGPAVHSIREGSSLEGHLFPEDLVVAVDDIDTRSFPAEEVIKMLSAKVDRERKITVLHFEDIGR